MRTLFFSHFCTMMQSIGFLWGWSEEVQFCFPMLWWWNNVFARIKRDSQSRAQWVHALTCWSHPPPLHWGTDQNLFPPLGFTSHVFSSVLYQWVLCLANTSLGCFSCRVHNIKSCLLPNDNTIKLPRLFSFFIKVLIFKCLHLGIGFLITCVEYNWSHFKKKSVFFLV